MQDTALVNLLLPALLAAIMLGMGTTLTPADFARVARQPRAAVIALLGQLLVLPALGFALAAALPLSPLMKVGLVLVAACPGGTMSNLICHLARGNTALSISLTAISSFATLVTIPLLVGLALASFAGSDNTLVMPVGRTMATLFGVVLIPVFIGMVIRGNFPTFAERSERWFSIAGVILMVVLIIGIIISERSTILTGIALVGPAVFALNLLAVAAGLALGKLASLGANDIVTLSIEVGIQNSSLAILLALTVMQNPAVAVPAGVYGLLMYLPAAAIIGWSRRQVGQQSSR